MGSTPIISMLKVPKCLAMGCEVFLAQEVESSRKPVELTDMEVVREYSDVFPDEFPSLPEPHEVEF